MCGFETKPALFRFRKTVSKRELGWVRGEEGFSTLAPPRSEGGGGRVGGGKGGRWRRRGGEDIEKEVRGVFATPLPPSY